MSKNVISSFLERKQKSKELDDDFFAVALDVSETYSPARKIGELLKKELAHNPAFYFFSPDETTSNKLDAVFDVEKRAWTLPKEPWDLPEHENGRIIELLSENILFSVMTGHVLNGEPAMLASYEAFLNIITSQLLQQIKFIKQCNHVIWRPKYPAINLLSTSTCWRQDHNGFTHQSPALISTLLANPTNLVNCFFPVDDIAAEEIFHYMLKSTNVVNLTTFNKIDEPRFLDKNTAKSQLQNHGITIFDDFSDEKPDIIFTAAGDIATKEALEAIKILKTDLPTIKIRFINIAVLSYRSIGTIDNKLGPSDFNDIFTARQPIIANFHGYPETFETILENYTYRGRLRVHGFNEEGSTTTPFEMLRKNAASRYDLAIDVANLANRQDLVQKYQDILRKNHEHALEFGEDLIK